MWFLILLGLSLGFGFLGPAGIADLAAVPGLRSLLVAGVLFLMGLGVSAPAVLESVRFPAAGLLALTGGTAADVAAREENHLS